VAGIVNAPDPALGEQTRRKHLLMTIPATSPGARPGPSVSLQSISDYLRGCLDAPVRSGDSDRALVLRSRGDERGVRRVYGVRVLPLPAVGSQYLDRG
jgi:hypothetical protein